MLSEEISVKKTVAKAIVPKKKFSEDNLPKETSTTKENSPKETKENLPEHVEEELVIVPAYDEDL